MKNRKITTSSGWLLRGDTDGSDSQLPESRFRLIFSVLTSANIKHYKLSLIQSKNEIKLMDFSEIIFELNDFLRKCTRETDALLRTYSVQ